jgi:hypothetical protein
VRGLLSDDIGANVPVVDHASIVLSQLSPSVVRFVKTGSAETLPIEADPMVLGVVPSVHR